MNSEAFVQALQAGQSWINDSVSANDHNICFIIVTAAQTFVHSLSYRSSLHIFFREGFGVGTRVFLGVVSRRLKHITAH